MTGAERNATVKAALAAYFVCETAASRAFVASAPQLNVAK
jgi:hypothetical protein